jgi:alpha-galactosidase
MSLRLPVLLLAAVVSLPSITLAAQQRLKTPQPLAATPPMGWNDWAHYQCDFTAETILANARALVSTGLAARGYRTVTIDDCWVPAPISCCSITSSCAFGI